MLDSEGEAGPGAACLGRRMLSGHLVRGEGLLVGVCKSAPSCPVHAPEGAQQSVGQRCPPWTPVAGACSAGRAS